MQGPWVAIQRNPKAGTGSGRAQILELMTQLRTRGIRPRLFSRRERMDAVLGNARRIDDLLCIVAAGGDGTVGDVLNRFPGVPIAVLPLGTENLLAKHLGIPRSGKFVADMNAEGSKRQFDVGMMGGRRFFLMASAGFDADVIHRLHASRKGPITKSSYLQPIWQSLRRYKHPVLRVSVDGSEQPVLARLLVVANLPAYAFGLPVAKSAVGDDGRFDLRMFQPGSGFQMFRYCYKVALGVHERLDDVKSIRASQIPIESDEPVPIQVDGDPAGVTPAEIRLLPLEMEVFIPPNKFAKET